MYQQGEKGGEKDRHVSLNIYLSILFLSGRRGQTSIVKYVFSLQFISFYTLQGSKDYMYRKQGQTYIVRHVFLSIVYSG